MSNLVNSLQSLITQASKLPPSGSLDNYERRTKYVPQSHSVILIDISGSMGEIVKNSRKIDLLRKALNRPLASSEIAIAFNSYAQILKDFTRIPEPEGGTALHFAIIEASIFNPSHTLIVSDGSPDSESQALQATNRLTGVISTLYIGSDDDLEAIAFMNKLARLGCGKSGVCDLKKSPSNLKGAIAGLLPER